MVYQAIADLIYYAEKTQLIEPCDRIWAENRILDAMGLDRLEERTAQEQALEDILRTLLDYAVEKGIIEDDIVSRDLFDTELMGRLTPRPGYVRSRFSELYRLSPKSATDWYYKFSCDSDYIRRYRIAKDMKWLSDTPFGQLDITINLSKPEKDPKAIAAAKSAVQSGYPKCQLCKENEGYAGRINHPARQNHRVIPIQIDGRDWFFQYSPYVYYNEHCIVFSGQHNPMKIDRSTFRKMLDFIKLFPHYFVGSNADLPIVGGSILSHDHFQGGNYSFAMDRAGIEQKLSFPGFEDIEAGIVHWPMSVIRLSCADDNRLVELADRILRTWRAYSDPQAMIFACTGDEMHNTITPIARMRQGKFELDLVLRNNICTPEHPLGLYHPHAELHHIKKENIGLIEVMGLAVLPPRLKTELNLLAQAICEGRDISEDAVLSKHADWVADMQSRHEFSRENIMDILKDEVGQIFAKVLEHAGVFKCDECGRKAFMKFIETVK